MIFSVSEANNFIKALLDAVPQLQTIFVRGEISNYKAHSSGHHYMTLKDRDAAINAVMFLVFALVGLAWAAINVNSLPMVVEMCKGSDIGKFTGYYYTFSMAAQVVTPILAGTLLKHISYSMLFPYAAFFVACSFVTMCFVRHGDCKVEAKAGLAAFEDMDAD